ncbi:Choline dehydrogenase [Salix suchowensis]|nr:Choline dehydrogenase [Salix suchowensis]
MDDWNQFGAITGDKGWSWHRLQRYFRKRLISVDDQPLKGWIQGTIKGGRRSSFATSYLGPRFVRRRNLHVLLHARVTRLLQDGVTGGKKSIRKVEFAQNAPASGVNRPFGPRRTVLASKSVILSGGSVMSQNIFMHSGIGDEQMLRRVGIKPLHNLPSVGRNLIDRSLTRLLWNVNSTEPTKHTLGTRLSLQPIWMEALRDRISDNNTV